MGGRREAASRQRGGSCGAESRDRAAHSRSPGEQTGCSCRRQGPHQIARFETGAAQAPAADCRHADRDGPGMPMTTTRTARIRRGQGDMLDAIGQVAGRPSLKPVRATWPGKPGRGRFGRLRHCRDPAPQRTAVSKRDCRGLACAELVPSVGGVRTPRADVRGIGSGSPRPGKEWAGMPPAAKLAWSELVINAARCAGSDPLPRATSGRNARRRHSRAECHKMWVWARHGIELWTLRARSSPARRRPPADSHIIAPRPVKRPFPRR